MKIDKKDLTRFICRRNDYHKYIEDQFDKGNIDLFKEGDEISSKNWEMYYGAMHDEFGDRLGDVLYALIEYAERNGLTIDHVINALRAMAVEVNDNAE